MSLSRSFVNDTIWTINLAASFKLHSNISIVRRNLFINDNCSTSWWSILSMAPCPAALNVLILQLRCQNKNFMVEFLPLLLLFRLIKKKQGYKFKVQRDQYLMGLKGCEKSSIFHCAFLLNKINSFSNAKISWNITQPSITQCVLHGYLNRYLSNLMQMSENLVYFSKICMRENWF